MAFLLEQEFQKPIDFFVLAGSVSNASYLTHQPNAGELWALVTAQAAGASAVINIYDGTTRRSLGNAADVNFVFYDSANYLQISSSAGGLVNTIGFSVRLK